MSERRIEVDGREVALRNLEKTMYPQAGFTKGDVVDYYTRIADVMLPHLRGRPVTLKRFPNGVEAPSFFEKKCPAHRPEWVETVAIDYAGGKREAVRYCLVENRATLVWLANLAAIEIHASLAKADDVTRPTMVAFDLDPGPPAGLLDAARLGIRLRETLEELGLTCVAKVSGGKGLHVYVPLNTPVTYEQTKPFANAIARRLERDRPDEVTANMSKARREGKVLVDWSQNSEHKTTACVYTLRGRARPTVSAPVRWDEVEAAVRKKNAASLTFEAPEALERVQREGDLFEAVPKVKQRLPEVGEQGGDEVRG